MSFGDSLPLSVSDNILEIHCRQVWAIIFGDSLPLSVRWRVKCFALPFYLFGEDMDLYEVTEAYVSYLRKFEPKKILSNADQKTQESL